MNADRILEDCPDIDCVGVGEGEELLPDYLDHLDDPARWRAWSGVAAAKSSRTPRVPSFGTWTSFPIPTGTSLPIDYIESLPLDVPAVLSLDKFCTVQTSRGCPYSCIYCDIPSLGEGRWRSRSPEHVLGELQELNDQGYRSIYLTDDHFLINRKRIDAICRGIIERKLKFHWGCEGRVDSVGIEQLPLMRQAGCSFLAFGVEAGTQKVWTASIRSKPRPRWRTRSAKRSGREMTQLEQDPSLGRRTRVSNYVGGHRNQRGRYGRLVQRQGVRDGCAVERLDLQVGRADRERNDLLRTYWGGLWASPDSGLRAGSHQLSRWFPAGPSRRSCVYVRVWACRPWPACLPFMAVMTSRGCCWPTVSAAGKWQG